jgi:hypothetical protein
LHRLLGQAYLSDKLPVTLKKAVETTDGHTWTQITTSCEKNGDHARGERFSPEKSVLICAHLWFSFFTLNRTGGFTLIANRVDK